MQAPVSEIGLVMMLPNPPVYIELELNLNIMIFIYSGLPESLNPDIVINSAKMISISFLENNSLCFKNYNEFPFWKYMEPTVCKVL